jgi:drug/metabolite transporter (DMT)-like permease
LSGRQAPLTFLVLAGAVAVVSTASIFIRFAQAQEASSLVIAAGRMGIAALVMAPFALPGVVREAPRLSRRALLLCLGSGFCLAIHFWSWIVSLEHTSVASSTVLVATNPLWVALASAWLLGERPARAALVGVALTLLGSAAIFISDTARLDAGPQSALGNTLALIGAVAASAYLLIGRAARGEVSLKTYVWIAYATAAALLWIVLLVRSGFPSLSLSVWVFIAALALGPQLLGHTAFNWALRRVSATFVALAILGEPIGSAVLAWWLLGEQFATLQLVGFVLLLVGIFAAARGESRR